MRQSHVVDDVTNAAVELFATQGYAKTSVQQIVTAAGVTKGAMYHYFTSKDDLLFGIYDQLLTMQKAHLDALIAEGQERGDDVDAVLRDDHGRLVLRAHSTRADADLVVEGRTGAVIDLAGNEQDTFTGSMAVDPHRIVTVRLD